MELQPRRIAVAARLRPALAAELGQEAAWAVDDTDAVVTDFKTGDTWSFDHVFGPDSDNGDLYSACCAGPVEAFCRGINGAVMAYGQTAAGKTHTMYGPGGIVERAVESIFASIGTTNGERDFTLTASFLEIYNEQVNDLLAEREVNILEGQRCGLVLQNLSSITVTSSAEVLACIARGDRRRRVGETAANVRSSRSHALLLLGLESRAQGEDVTRCSQLILADLAGSEGLRHSEASSPEQRREGRHINRSLLALTQVIQALSECGPRSLRANFRDSKLTRILRPSLGGNAQMVLVCALSPSAASRHETRSTLEFAARARRVENHACVNLRHDGPRVDPQYQALRRELRELRSRVAELQGVGGHAVRMEDLAQENQALRLKTEALQAMLLASSREDLLAGSASPCRQRRRFSVPTGQDPAEAAFMAALVGSPEEMTPDYNALYGAEASPVAGAWASPSRLRQPGWRSRHPLRSDVASPGPPCGLGRGCMEPVAELEEACPEPGESSHQGASSSAGRLPSTVCQCPVGSWEYPLTKAEKHARLIHLFAQELSAVQTQEATQSQSELPSETEPEEEHEDNMAVTFPAQPAMAPQWRRRLEASSSASGFVRHLLKHEGCGLCAVQ